MHHPLYKLDDSLFFHQRKLKNLFYSNISQDKEARDKECKEREDSKNQSKGVTDARSNHTIKDECWMKAVGGILKDVSWSIHIRKEG